MFKRRLSGVAIVALAFIASLTVAANAQRSELAGSGDPAISHPTATEIQNALSGAEEQKRKEAEALALLQNVEPVNDSPTAPPANDNFAAAQVITGTGGAASGTNVEATFQGGEPLYNGNNKTVWYRWTAPANLSMTIETTGAGTLNDTVLGIFTGGAVNTLTQVAEWGDDINGAQNLKSRITFIANAGTVYRIQVSGFGNSEGTFALRWEINRAETNKQFNFDGALGSGASDFSVYRPSNGYWYINFSLGGFLVRQWGTSTDRLMPGDYDGDGSTDIAVWRPSNGTFYVLHSETGTFEAFQWGANGDVPVQGDFDGDDHADFAVWRPSGGDFYVRRSRNGGFTYQQWGALGDFVACGDYDGDGKTDFGVQRGASGFGTFYVLRSSDGGFIGRQFGLSSDLITPGDYDGDGKNDIAVLRTGSNYSFYYLHSADGGFGAVQWGVTGDIPVLGDYVSGSRSDICVWRPSNGTFYCYGDGGTGSFYAFQFGQNGDFPIGSSNVH